MNAPLFILPYKLWFIDIDSYFKVLEKATKNQRYKYFTSIDLQIRIWQHYSIDQKGLHMYVVCTLLIIIVPYSPSIGKCFVFLFVPAFEYKIYCLMLYHLLKSTLHPKANACSIGTFITFYMQSSLYSKANACNIGTFIRSYIQMRVQIKNKAFAYRFYRPFTQQWTLKTLVNISSLFFGF